MDLPLHNTPYEISLSLPDGTVSPMKLHYATFREAVKTMDGFESDEYKASFRLNDGQGHEYTYPQARALLMEIDASGIAARPPEDAPRYTKDELEDIIATIISRVCEMSDVYKAIWKRIVREWEDHDVKGLHNQYGDIALGMLPAMYLADIVKSDPELQYLIEGREYDGPTPDEGPIR